jgi:hypothetical protein
MPSSAGTAKGVAVGEIDGRPGQEVVSSCERAKGDLHGVGYLTFPPRAPCWIGRDINGAEGVNYDRVELVDLGGDLDVLTCEEAANLGVIWYESPAKGERSAGDGG